MACSRISSVQRFHLMPKDWADQKRNQVRTDLQELTQGGHFLLVYYNPISELYEAITSQSWSPVVQSKELQWWMRCRHNCGRERDAMVDEMQAQLRQETEATEEAIHSQRMMQKNTGRKDHGVMRTVCYL